jgi:hypothetical protein
MRDDYWRRQEIRREVMREEERRRRVMREEDMRRRKLEALKIADQERVKYIEQLRRVGKIKELNAKIEGRRAGHEERPVSDDPNSRSEKHPLDGSGSGSVVG